MLDRDDDLPLLEPPDFDDDFEARDLAVAFDFGFDFDEDDDEAVLDELEREAAAVRLDLRPLEPEPEPEPELDRDEPLVAPRDRLREPDELLPDERESDGRRDWAERLRPRCASPRSSS